jgi:AcrR family transcriptional regulator
MARPSSSRDSKGLVLRAARTEFAAHGFTGAGVDRIAARAGVNKAMIYYHFGSKIALYRAVIGEGLTALTAAARAAVAIDAPAGVRLDRYVRSLMAGADAHPYVVPLMLRELADGGRNLDRDGMQRAFGLFGVVRDVLESGLAAGEFDRVDPLLTHFVILGAAMVYIANEPLRKRIRRMRLTESARAVPVGTEPFLRHMSLMLRRTLRATAGEEFDA